MNTYEVDFTASSCGAGDGDRRRRRALGRAHLPLPSRLPMAEEAALLEIPRQGWRTEARHVNLTETGAVCLVAGPAEFVGAGAASLGEMSPGETIA
jgi:hypothetical protein